MMNTIRYIRLLCAVLLTSFCASAQIVEEHYFRDTLGGGLDFIRDHIQQEDGIVLSGYKGNFYTNVPVVVKVDLNGDVLWSTDVHYSPDSSQNAAFELMLFRDSFVYGISTSLEWPDYIRTLWKINSQTGEIAYTVPYPNANGANLYHPYMTDFDDTTFYTMHGFTIRRMDKSTGTILQETALSDTTNYNNFEIHTDKNHNLYVLQGDQVIKFNGNDSGRPLWSRTYNEFDLDELHRLYIDDYGDVFVFGRDGGTFSAGNGIVMKIDKQSGIKTWICRVENLADTDMTEEDVQIVDFKDRGGKIYATYQHAFVGGGDKKIITAKISKSNGNLDWLSQLGIDNTGANLSWQGRSALSLDVDCEGNVYQTGYYRSDNYGPGLWGSMKLNGTTGAKLYEFTVSEDTLDAENLSTGLGAFAYGDHPVFVGHEQVDVTSYDVTPLFVKVDPDNGEITLRKPIGRPLQGFASTLKVQRKDDNLYLLKQNGIAVTAEVYDAQHESVWEYTYMNDSIITYGDQLVLTDSSFVFTAHQPLSGGGTNLIVTRLDRLTGVVLSQDSLAVLQDNIAFYEAETDDATTFVFAKTPDSLFYSKVSSGQFSPLHYLDAATSLTGVEGEVNQVLNDNADSLIVLGSNGLFSIRKDSLQLQFIETYTEPAYYVSFTERNDTLVLCGRTAANEQILTVKERFGWNTIWSQTYASNGGFAKSVLDDTGIIYAAGTENGNLNVRRIFLVNGAEDWSYSTDNVLYPNSQALDITYNPFKDYLAVAGFNSPSGNSSSALIQLLTTQGDTIFTWAGHDDISGKSRANSIAIAADSLVCIGGAHNQLHTTYEGFIFYLDSITAPIDYTGIDDVASGSDCMIYPNPATDKVFIKGLREDYSYTIYNLTGDLIQNREHTSDYEIDLGQMASGAYHLHIRSGSSTIFFLLIVL